MQVSKHIISLAAVAASAFVAFVLVAFVLAAKVLAGLGTMFLAAMEKGHGVQLPDFLRGAGVQVPQQQLDVDAIRAVLDAPIPSKQQRAAAKAALDAYLV